MYDVKYPGAVIGFCLVVAILFTIAGCGSEMNPVSIEAASTLKNVPGLQDCQAYKGFIDSRQVTIVRCPNSATSAAFSSGKSTAGSVTIDDYARAITEWEESKKKVDERIKELQSAQKEYDDLVSKLKR